MSRIAIAVAALLAAGQVVAAPVPVANPAELPVPANAVVVAQLYGVHRVKGRLTAMLKAAVPDLAEKWGTVLDDATSGKTSGRDLTPLTADGRALVVLTGFEDLGSDAPPAAVLLPVGDYKAFREKVLSADERASWENGKPDRFTSRGQKLYAVDLTARGGYVAVTPNEETADLFAGKFDKLTAAKMGEGIADAFLSADASVYVNMAAVNERYGDAIKNFRQLFQLLLQQGGMGVVPGLDRKQIEMAKVVYDGLFQAAEDARGLAVGVGFRPDGLATRVELAVAPGSPSGKLLAAEKPVKLAAVGDLPAGMMSYTGGRVGAPLATALAQLGREFAAAEDDDKAPKLVDDYTSRSVAALADGGGFARGSRAPEVSLTVDRVPEPGKLVDAQLKVFEGLSAGGSYLNVVLKEKPKVTPAAQKVGRYTLNEARMVLDFEATVKGIPDDNLRDTTMASMKRFVAEKPTVWFGTDGERLLEVTAKDWPAAKKLIDGYLSGADKVGGQAGFRAAASALPAEASVLSLTEVGEALKAMRESFAEVAESIPGLPVREVPKLAPSGGDPAYVGLAVVLTPGSARFDLAVPAGAVKKARTMLSPVLERVGE